MKVGKAMEIEKANVILTRSQINNLIEFFEMWFIESIRQDEGVDNIEYIIDMMDVLKELRSSREVLDAIRSNVQQ